MSDDRVGWLRSFTDTPRVNALMLKATGKRAFDVGANGGYVAKVLTRAFDEVIAIEPCIESYEHLIPRCPIPNLIPLNMALSDHVGVITLGVKAFTETMGELFTGDSLDEWGPDLDVRDVPCTTMDTLAEEYGYPDFVKIDTEGHEALIMDGAHEVFSRHPKFIIEIHDARWGREIQDYFDSIDLPYTNIHHLGYEPDSYNYNNHFWMVWK